MPTCPCLNPKKDSKSCNVQVYMMGPERIEAGIPMADSVPTIDVQFPQAVSIIRLCTKIPAHKSLQIAITHIHEQIKSKMTIVSLLTLEILGRGFIRKHTIV